ncbi:hypothetical protein BARVI_09005 [Barnesiella viscericola DSM 18177]|uniref:Secretion system C-terminal sorting domain-containing protein n=1 Tax=Barnesiella viscericola DSM 18177 TaxID=880074 RepID=W0EWE8_9BACT|nr:T9SS type A sorting domain-containing protein [Barnesiella viscericola]AHF13878.1 hypothetical protein BARVI_09005 [Barnesiella viscericola DSM 18177]
MKHNLLFAVVMMTAIPFFVAADNGILSSSLNLGGDDLSIAAYCQNGDDYLVEEVYSAGSNEPNVYNIYDSSLQKVYTITDYVKNVSFLNSTNHAYKGEDEKFLFSQTLLNDDAEFEYMVAKEREVDMGNYSYWETYGFKIMQTNGNCLADITFPEASSLETCQFIQLKDKMYFSVEANSLLFYEVNREGSSNVLNLVAETKNVTGYPNPVQRGEVYTVDGGKRSLKNAVVNVVRLDGSLVQSFSIGNNDKAEIETSQMNSGVYVYTAVRGNKVVASGRFVVE